MFKQSCWETGLFVYLSYIPNLAIYLRFGGPKFSDVQITIRVKTGQHAPNPPKITGCFLLYKM